MPDLSFEVIGAEAPPYTALPMLVFKLRVTNANEEEQIQNITLKSQIMLTVTHRRYNAEEKAKLRELFGEPERWGQTLRTFLWTHVTTGYQGSQEAPSSICQSHAPTTLKW